jgi:hypothetical protein
MREKAKNDFSMNATNPEHSTNQELIKLEKQIERLDQRITDVSMIAGEIYLNNPNDLRLEGLYKKIERLSDLRNKINNQLHGDMIDM